MTRRSGDPQLRRVAAKGQFAPRGPLRGSAKIPGDKSISHRALMLAALAVGQSRIDGLNEGEDVRATAAALRAMGVGIERGPDGVCIVSGVGVGGLLQPERTLDLGNSGTSARLLMGLVASHPIRAVFTGDPSLSHRPMARIADPLRRIGARIDSDRLALTVEGIQPGAPTVHRLGIPSAQVKSALLLAGLNIPGITEVVEAAPTRDHLERLLKLFGAAVETDGSRVRLEGHSELRPQRLAIAGDPSAAAFLAVAALVVPGSEIRLEGVCVNPRRIGLYSLLAEMGGQIAFERHREAFGEPIADIVVRHSALRGTDVPPELIVDMIDEFPILFVAAAFAEGATRARGLAELRVKESDRLAAMASGLRAIGAGVEEHDDGLTVHGSGGEPLPGGAAIAAGLDHRIAMSFAVAGLHAKEPIGVRGMDSVATSFPDFSAALEGLTEA